MAETSTNSAERTGGWWEVLDAEVNLPLLESPGGGGSASSQPLPVNRFRHSEDPETSL